MSLTKLQYKKLWQTHFKNIVKVRMPSYEKYLDREKAFEKYLNLFRIGNKRSIKYILIAEAPPQSGEYIYFGNSSNYLSAPLKAFDIKLNKNSTNKALILLADAGVLILDLFPFTINFSEPKNTRSIIINNDVPLNYFYDLNNQYSIYYRLNKLYSLQPQIKLAPKIKVAFMATPLINHYLCQLAYYKFICEDGSELEINRRLNNKKNDLSKSNKTWTNVNKKKYPIFVACCNSSSGYPNSELIKHALNLK